MNELAEYTVYYCTAQRNRETIVTGKLVAMNVFHGLKITDLVHLHYDC